MAVTHRHLDGRVSKVGGSSTNRLSLRASFWLYSALTFGFGVLLGHFIH